MIRENTICPLCASKRTRAFSRDKHRDYLRCEMCALVFVPSCQHLSVIDEKKRYDLHENSAQDPGYSGFLRRMFIPLQERLPAGSRGLDFGSGPAPVLAGMFEQVGHVMTTFDYYYAPSAAALETQYDFITATEVVEHLREPAKILDRLAACLRPGGWLGIMTRRCVGPEAFPTWHYKNDLTHICFYSHETFQWLAAQWKAEMTVVEEDVILFRTKAVPR